MKIWNEEDIQESVEGLIAQSTIDTVVQCIARHCEQEAEKATAWNARCYDRCQQGLLDALDYLSTRDGS